MLFLQPQAVNTFLTDAIKMYLARKINSTVDTSGDILSCIYQNIGNSIYKLQNINQYY